MVILQDSDRNRARLCIILQDNYSKLTGANWRPAKIQFELGCQKVPRRYRLIVELDKTNRHVTLEICQFIPFLMMKSQVDQTKQKRRAKSTKMNTMRK